MIAAIAERFFFFSGTAAITAIVAVIWKPGLIVVCEDNSQIQSLSEELIVGDSFAFRIIKILFGMGMGKQESQESFILFFFSIISLGCFGTCI